MEIPRENACSLNTNFEEQYFNNRNKLWKISHSVMKIGMVVMLYIYIQEWCKDRTVYFGVQETK